VAWHSLRRARWPGRRARVSGEVWGVSRARARAGLRVMRWGSECGHGRGSKGAGAWAERCGRGSRRRARVRVRWSTAGAGRVELTRKAHGVEREKGRAGQWLGVWQNGPARQRGKKGAGGKQLTPTSWPHWAERGRGKARGAETATDRWRPPVRQRGRAAWLCRAGPAGLLCLFLFL
jgi:hypothetical protein